MIEILGLLFSFIMLIVIVAMQVDECKDFKFGFIILIGWTLFLVIFISSAYILTK